MVKRVMVFEVAVFLSLFCAAGLHAGDGPWEKVKEAEGITVYARPVEGSDFKEFRAECLIEAPMEAVNNVLMDVPRLTEWMPSVIVAEVIEYIDGKGAVMYEEMKSPWPVRNRDFLFEVRIARGPESIVRVIRAIGHEKYPAYAPREGRVRVTRLTGRWDLLKRDRATYVVYGIRSDPGGSLPAWLANSAARDLPFLTLRGLKRLANEPRYRGR